MLFWPRTLCRDHHRAVYYQYLNTLQKFRFRVCTEAGVVCLFGRHHKQQLESETRRCCLASNLVQRPPPRGLLSVFEHSLELQVSGFIPCFFGPWTRPRIFLDCFVLKALSSKAKQLRNRQACIYLLRICTIPRHNHK